MWPSASPWPLRSLCWKVTAFTLICSRLAKWYQMLAAKGISAGTGTKEGEKKTQNQISKKVGRNTNIITSTLNEDFLQKTKQTFLLSRAPDKDLIQTHTCTHTHAGHLRTFHSVLMLIHAGMWRNYEVRDSGAARSQNNVSFSPHFKWNK